MALLRRRAAETVALAGALGAPEQAKRWLDDLPARTARDHRRDDLLAAGLEGCRPPLDAATAAMLDGATGRDAQLGGALAAPPQ